MKPPAPRIPVRVGNREILAEVGTTVAAVLANAGIEQLRQSVSGEGRGVLCGMGICQECRVTIDGIAHRRACMTVVAPGMTIDPPPGRRE